MKTGELGTGKWAHARWCVECDKYHGNLHICNSYPEELKEELLRDTENFIKWINKENERIRKLIEDNSNAK
jgi:hypothetical protein